MASLRLPSAAVMALGLVLTLTGCPFDDNRPDGPAEPPEAGSGLVLEVGEPVWTAGGAAVSGARVTGLGADLVVLAGSQERPGGESLVAAVGLDGAQADRRGERWRVVSGAGVQWRTHELVPGPDGVVAVSYRRLTGAARTGVTGFDPVDGSARWRWVAPGRGPSPYVEVLDASESVVLAGVDPLGGAGGDGGPERTVALDATDGTVLWTSRLDFEAGRSLGQGVALASDRGRQVLLDERTGRPLIRFDDGEEVAALQDGAAVVRAGLAGPSELVDIEDDVVLHRFPDGYRDQRLDDDLLRWTSVGADGRDVLQVWAAGEEQPSAAEVPAELPVFDTGSVVGHVSGPGGELLVSSSGAGYTVVSREGEIVLRDGGTDVLAVSGRLLLTTDESGLAVRPVSFS